MTDEDKRSMEMQVLLNALDMLAHSYHKRATRCCLLGDDQSLKAMAATFDQCGDELDTMIVVTKALLGLGEQL